MQRKFQCNNSMKMKVQPTLEMSFTVYHLHRRWWNVSSIVIVSNTIIITLF